MAPLPPEAAASYTPAAAPSSASIERTVGLILRLLSLASLVVSVIVLTTNSTKLEFDDASSRIRFQDIHAYRYMLSAAVIGLAYTVVQTFFAFSQLATGSQPYFLLNFYGDKIASYMLATGAAAGFGVTKDMKDFLVALFDKVNDSGDHVGKFFDKGYASASLLLIAFLCTAILSIFSSYALRKCPLN